MLDQIDRMATEAETINEDQEEKTFPEEVQTKSGESNVVRFLDGSNSFRKYYISWFLCDDMVIRPFIIENETEGVGVLSRLLGDRNNYYKGGFLESKKSVNNVKLHTYKSKDPELFKSFAEYFNPAFNGTSTCRPSKEYVFNVIHRNPNFIDDQEINWCSINKHTKLMRFKQRAFKTLNVVRQNSGSFEEYDIYFSKEGKGSDMIPTSMRAGINTQYNVVGELTDEEKAYERYDLDHISRLATANYILSNLREKIGRVDAVMGSSFVQELENQKALEEQAYAEAANNNEEASFISGITTPTPVSAQASSPTSHQGNIPIESVVPQRQPQTPTHPAIPPRVEATPQVQSESVSRVQENVISSGATVSCGHCKAQVPVGLPHCSKCGGILLMECDVCKKPFDAFASECPHCGQVYKQTS